MEYLHAHGRMIAWRMAAPAEQARGQSPRLVDRRAEDTPKATAADLARLEAALDGPIDTSDSPERKGPFRRIKRDAQGRLPQPIPNLRDSPIHLAILGQLERRRMTLYELRQAAKAHCAKLPASAVYEYLRGQRVIGIHYAEALIEAAGLVVAPRKPTRRPATAVEAAGPSG